MYKAFLLIFVLNVMTAFPKPFRFINYDVEQNFMRDDVGNYNYGYNTRFSRPEDDVGHSETGKIVKTSSGEDVLRVNGTYHYAQSCHEMVTVHYTADENGFIARIVQSSGAMYTRVNGTIVGITIVCSASENPSISSSCLSSLQGTCVG